MLDILTESPQPLFERDVIISSILQMRKLKLSKLPSFMFKVIVSCQEKSGPDSRQ